MKKNAPFLVVPGNDPGTKRPPATAAPRQDPISLRRTTGPP